MNINCSSIGNWFSGLSTLESLTLGNNVNTIGYAAFKDCRKIKSLVVGDGVRYIDINAFRGCTGLTACKLGRNVTNIGDAAFYGCIKLVSISIPEQVRIIGKNAFFDCSSLAMVEFASIESLCAISFGDQYSNPLSYVGSLYVGGNKVDDIVIPETIATIGQYTFCGCSMNSLAIPSSVTSIDETAFSSCNTDSLHINCKEIGTWFKENKSLKTVTVGESAVAISDNAFLDCTNMNSLNLCNGITSIGTNAFKGCGITTLNIPSSVNSIGLYAFESCPINELSIGCKSIGNWFSGYNKLKSVRIGDSTSSIAESAFSDCSGLVFVYIPASVKSIGKDAFSNCNSLTKAEFANLDSLYNISFANENSNPLKFAHNLYTDGKRITTITIPSSKSRIGQYNFIGCSLESMIIPSSVTTVENGAFI